MLSDALRYWVNSIHVLDDETSFFSSSHIGLISPVAFLADIGLTFKVTWNVCVLTHWAKMEEHDNTRYLTNISIVPESMLYADFSI